MSNSRYEIAIAYPIGWAARFRLEYGMAFYHCYLISPELRVAGANGRGIPRYS